MYSAATAKNRRQRLRIIIVSEPGRARPRRRTISWRSCSAHICQKQTTGSTSERHKRSHSTETDGRNMNERRGLIARGLDVGPSLAEVARHTSKQTTDHTNGRRGLIRGLTVQTKRRSVVSSDARGQDAGPSLASSCSAHICQKQMTDHTNERRQKREEKHELRLGARTRTAKAQDHLLQQLLGTHLNRR